MLLWPASKGIKGIDSLWAKPLQPLKQSSPRKGCPACRRRSAWRWLRSCTCRPPKSPGDFFGKKCGKESKVLQRNDVETSWKMDSSVFRLDFFAHKKWVTPWPGLHKSWQAHRAVDFWHFAARSSPGSKLLQDDDPTRMSPLPAWCRPNNVGKTISEPPNFWWFIPSIYHLFMVIWGMVYYCFNQNTVS